MSISCHLLSSVVPNFGVREEEAPSGANNAAVKRNVSAAVKVPWDVSYQHYYQYYQRVYHNF